jgi:phosphatidate cytidylyltransferase
MAPAAEKWRFPMHAKRWITGLALAPFIVALVYWGGHALFAIVIAIVAWLALWEYFRIVRTEGDTAMPLVLPALAYLFSPIMIWAAYHQNVTAILSLLTANLLCGGLAGICYFGRLPGIAARVFQQVLGLVYVPMLFAHLVLLRIEPQGALWIFLVLAVIFAGDIGALYVGTALGRHKLSPSVSPNKTVEGALGGLAANIVMVLAFNRLVFPLLAWPQALVLAVLIGAAGQLGDLFESMLKRGAGVKDSGHILPGHGGLLDRLDALMFAAPVAYYFKIVWVS